MFGEYEFTSLNYNAERNKNGQGLEEGVAEKS